MILHGIIVLIIFWAIFSRTHRIKADVSAMKQKNDQDHDILAREVLRHREMILRQEEANRKFEIETERIKREVERQAEQLAKLTFQIEEAEADILTAQQRISQLYGLLDIAEANRAAATPGSKQDESAQRKIISLENQIAAAEKKLRSAQFKKQTAETKLAA